MGNPAVLYEKKGTIGYITINRLEVYNAVNPEVLCRLADHLQDYLLYSTLRVAIISGAGDEAFCSGADLGRLIPLLTGARQPEDTRDHRVFNRQYPMANYCHARLYASQAVDRSNQWRLPCRGYGTDTDHGYTHCRRSCYFWVDRNQVGTYPHRRVAGTVTSANTLLQGHGDSSGGRSYKCSAHRIGLVNTVVAADQQTPCKSRGGCTQDCGKWSCGRA